MVSHVIAGPNVDAFRETSFHIFFYFLLSLLLPARIHPSMTFHLPSLSHEKKKECHLDQLVSCQTLFYISIQTSPTLERKSYQPWNAYLGFIKTVTPADRDRLSHLPARAQNMPTGLSVIRTYP